MQSISCLKNLVGYKTPCEVSPSLSGYYVNQIKGVGFKFAENIADEEYRTGKDFIEGLLEQSKLMVIDEMEMHLRPYYRQNSLQAANCMCAFADGYGDEYSGERGVEIKKLDRSNYKKIYISRVLVCIENTDNVTIKIDDGGMINTFAPVECVGGVQTEIVLNYMTSFDDVKIYFDQTGMNVRNTSCSIGCATCGSGSRKFNNENNSVIIHGFDQTHITGTNFFGMVPCISIECVPSNLVCDFSKSLALPLLYKWGGLFYSEVWLSKRINKYTLHTKEEAQQMAVYYDNFDENAPGMYQKQMRSVVNSILPYLNSIDDDCIECNSNRYGWVTG